MNLMEEDAMRRKALAMQAELAAKGVRAGAENRVASAAARAPEAAARGKGAFRSPPSTPSGATQREETQEKKTKPNRRENEFMLNLMVLRNTLRVNAPACRERAKAAGKWIWRDIRLMLTLVNKIQDGLLKTMPETRDEYYSAYALHGHYELRIDGPIRNARHILVTDKHLASICEAAMKSECVLCMRDGDEIGQCPLREALLEAAPPSELQEGLWRKCEYRDAAGQLIRGEDATV